MLTSLQIQNFRCFEHLTLEPLGQVNLIGGVNNVGKTSVLEALFIFLAPDNPLLSAWINNFRGIQANNFLAGEILSESIWGWLFRNNKKNQNIKIESLDEQQNEISLEIILGDLISPQIIENNKENQINYINDLSYTADLRSHEVILIYRIKNQEFKHLLSPGPDGKIRILERANIPQISNSIFCFPHSRENEKDAERLSSLIRSNRQGEILNVLQSLEPRLTSLELLFQGRTPVIAGDIGVGELIPIRMMGAGIGRLLSIVLAITDTPNAILIDEIENGLHYSVLPSVWKGIERAAREYNTQVFSTTHSIECIQAAHEVFGSSKGPYNFRYHRLENVGDEIKAITYDQETISTSVEMNFEMR